MEMYWIIVNILLVSIQLISSENIDVHFSHFWNKRDDEVSITFNVSNLTLNEYRYYFFDLHPFASLNQIEYFSRQRLIDTQNSLSIIGLHENDYISCVSFIDQYENIYKPRSTCYEFTLGEKTIGSHHGGTSGLLTPLLIAFVFVIHVFIAIIHRIKAKNYAQKLLHRFIDVNSKTSKSLFIVKHSLKQLDHPFVSSSVQRRLSRVTLGSTNKTEEDRMSISQQNRRFSMGIMKAIPEYIP